MSKSDSKLVMGIDTSCDETSVAILEDGKKVLANIISSQVKLHAVHGGVVPELASRSHIENMEAVVETALQKAGVRLQDLTGIAVTAAPGLIGCLLVGFSYAKSLAYALKIPFTSVHHLKGHLLSPFLEVDEIYPFLGLVVSGGHTALYQVDDFDTVKILGQTVDDAAGEAYDKVAKLLGLGYPGGPVIDKLAQIGDDKAFKFTRARVKKGIYYYSFSGLKTQVLNVVKKHSGLPQTKEQLMTDPFVLNLSASFQKEVVESLLEKVELAVDEFGPKAILISGGVAMNSLLRKRAKETNWGIPAYLPSPLVCTDNGAMIAYVGAKQLEKDRFAALDSNAFATHKLY